MKAALIFLAGLYFVTLFTVLEGGKTSGINKHPAPHALQSPAIKPELLRTEPSYTLIDLAEGYDRNSFQD